ncbi:D-alanyl-D-alanine carboxypeptidase [Nonomuraea antimicrobica]
MAKSGVKRVEGRVLVDTSLFAEGSEKLANNVTATISPIMVNDNVVDVTVKPGRRGRARLCQDRHQHGRPQRCRNGAQGPGRIRRTAG